MSKPEEVAAEIERLRSEPGGSVAFAECYNSFREKLAFIKSDGLLDKRLAMAATVLAERSFVDFCMAHGEEPSDVTDRMTYSVYEQELKSVADELIRDCPPNEILDKAIEELTSLVAGADEKGWSLLN